MKNLMNLMGSNCWSSKWLAALIGLATLGSAEAEIEVLVGNVAPQADATEEIYVYFDGAFAGSLAYKEFAQLNIPDATLEVIARRANGEQLARRSIDEFIITFPATPPTSFDGYTIMFGGSDSNTFGFDWFLVPDPVLPQMGNYSGSLAHLAPFTSPNSSYLTISRSSNFGSGGDGTSRMFGYGTLGRVGEATGRSGFSAFGRPGSSFPLTATYTPLWSGLDPFNATITVTSGTKLLAVAVGDGENQPLEAIWVVLDETNQPPALPPTSDEDQKFSNGLDGMWHNPSIENQGLLIKQLREGTVFYWATFDDDGSPLWLFGMDQSGSTDGTVLLDVFRYDGSYLNVPDITPSQSLWGTIEVSNTSCDELNLAFESEAGDSGEIALFRLGNQSGLRCLSEPDPELSGVRFYSCPPIRPTRALILRLFVMSNPLAKPITT